jgi:CRP/FNR family transcriptional regulator
LIFSSLSDDELTELSTIVSEHSLNSEQYLFWEGDYADYFYIVAQGKVKVLKHATTGKEFIIAFFSPGEMFGEVAAFEKKPYPASAQAVSASVVFRIQREDFISFLNKHPQVVLRIIGILSERLRVAQSRLRDLAAERVEQRLAGILLMLTTKLGPTLPFTRQEIADMTGTTTETAIRVISQLKDRRIIKSSRGQIEIIDEPNLRRLTEDSH